MTGNAWRGELEMMLDGRAYLLRPTFEALSRIEQELATGVMALGRKLAEGNLTLHELAVVITHCAQGEVSLVWVKETLVRGQMAQALEAVAGMLALVFGGDDAG